MCPVLYTTTRHVPAMKYPSTTCTALAVAAFASCIPAEAFLFRPVLVVSRSSSIAGASRSTCSSCPQTSFRASSRAASAQQMARRGRRRTPMLSGTPSMSSCTPRWCVRECLCVACFMMLCSTTAANIYSIQCPINRNSNKSLYLRP